MELSESISDDARAYGVDGVSYSYVYKMNKVCLTLGKGKAKEELENFVRKYPGRILSAGGIFIAKAFSYIRST